MNFQEVLFVVGTWNYQKIYDNDDPYIHSFEVRFHATALIMLAIATYFYGVYSILILQTFFSNFFLKGNTWGQSNNFYLYWSFFIIKQNGINKKLQNFICEPQLAYFVCSLACMTPLTSLRSVWSNGWVFVYELSGSGFESCCSHLDIFII